MIEMLKEKEHYDIEKENSKDLFYVKKKGLKRQIILAHTSRNHTGYQQSLNLRYGGKYTKIPTFIVKRDGGIIKNFPPEYHSEFFGDEKIDKYSITITLENRGWLVRNTQNGEYIDWLGDIYKGEVITKKWRGKLFWEPYTTKQTESVKKLVGDLCEKFRIPEKFIGHNVKFEGVERFKGIVCRSNYSEHWTDLSPAFNFELLTKEK
jgi:hypothetical protein|tara:strand:- start:4375 stop:4995 length:621 start_codon:yes stop_codon:yes gene_type:complete